MNSEAVESTRTRNAEKFFARAVAKHGQRFDYSRFVYTTAKEASFIGCSQHGYFSQTPDKHLSATHACPGCWLILRGKNRKKPRPYKRKKLVDGNRLIRIEPEEYLRRLAAPADFEVDMTEYDGMTLGTVTITCPKHGSFTQIPNMFLRLKNGCPGCGADERITTQTKSYANFLEAVTGVHGDRYTLPYPEEYENRKSIVTVVCQEHGAFPKKAQKLLSGQGCYRCRMDELVTDGTLSGGYNDALFASNPKLASTPGVLYYLRVGNVYKIGIARADRFKDRLRSIRSASKLEVEALDTHECELAEAFRLEQTILNDFHAVRTYEHWSTEIFREDVMAGVLLAEYAAAIETR